MIAFNRFLEASQPKKTSPQMDIRKITQSEAMSKDPAEPPECASNHNNMLDPAMPFRAAIRITNSRISFRKRPYLTLTLAQCH